MTATAHDRADLRERAEAGDADAVRRCDFCDAPFERRKSGGSAQRFCGEPCRRAFERALRAWRSSPCDNLYMLGFTHAMLMYVGVRTIVAAPSSSQYGDEPASRTLRS